MVIYRGILHTIDPDRIEDNGSIENASIPKVGSNPLGEKLHTKVCTF
jgi:hypothetical protein